MEIFIALLLVIALGAQFIYFRGLLKKWVTKPEILDSVAKEIDGLITELNQNADRNLTLMEERIGVLQKILGEADKRILILKKEDVRSKSTSLVYTHLEKSRPLKVPVKTSQDRSPVILEPTPEEPRVKDESPVAKVQPELFAEEKEPVKPQVPTTREKVFTLFDRGLPSAAISKNLGITLGEVELILSLGVKRS